MFFAVREGAQGVLEIEEKTGNVKDAAALRGGGVVERFVSHHVVVVKVVAHLALRPGGEVEALAAGGVAADVDELFVIDDVALKTTRPKGVGVPGVAHPFGSGEIATALAAWKVVDLSVDVDVVEAGTVAGLATDPADDAEDSEAVLLGGAMASDTAGVGRNVAGVDAHARGDVLGAGAGAGIAVEVVAAEMRRHVPDPFFRGMAFAAFGRAEGLLRVCGGLNRLSGGHLCGCHKEKCRRYGPPEGA